MLLAWPRIPGGKSYYINGWVGKNVCVWGGDGSIKMGVREMRTCLQTGGAGTSP